MVIRWAEKSDLQRLVDIFNYEVQNGTSSFSIRPRTLEERTVWFEQHDRDAFPLIAAEEDGKAVGYASLSVYRDNDAYAATMELSVYVDHEYRGRKIGEALMTELIRIARENGKVHAIVSVITADNIASIRLHEKFGFVYCGVTKEVGWKFNRWLDAAYYQLII